jgi:hypothetical protein
MTEGGSFKRSYIVISTKRSAWRNLCRRQRQGSVVKERLNATKVARFLHVGRNDKEKISDE